MPINYRCEPEMIDKILTKMKAQGIISPYAVFNFSAKNDLRKEVTYRDSDFLRRLSFSEDVTIVDNILKILIDKKIVTENSSYDKIEFDEIRKIIKKTFKVPWTSITKVMERLLFMLFSVKNPESVFAAGIYCGNTLVWNISPAIFSKSYHLKSAFGIDIDPQAITLAKENFSNLPDSISLKLVNDDAIKYATEFEGEIDYLYLDAECESKGKEIYLDILKILYPKIKKGGWILAHDSTIPSSKKELKKYLEYVRDKDFFTESINFDIDPYGLELTIK